MGVLLLILLGAACVFSVGVGLWVVCSHFLTTDIPAAIGHPVRLHVLYCLFQLLVTWVSLVCFLCSLMVRVKGRGGRTYQKLLVE